MTWDKNDLLKQMIKACESHYISNWEDIKPQVENELKSLLLIFEWIVDMKKNGTMNTEQARIHLDIQKNTMRTRLMAVSGTTLTDTENIINHAIDQIRKQLYEHIEWVLI